MSTTASSKRKAGAGGPNQGPAKKSTFDSENKATKELFAQFLAAYKGESQAKLGQDHPARSGKLINSWRPHKCHAIFGFSESSILLPKNENDGLMRLKIDPFSQNPLLELRLGSKDNKESFLHCQTIYIGAEQLDDDIVIKKLEKVTVQTLKDELRSLKVSPLEHDDSYITGVLTGIMTKNAVDIIHIKLAGLASLVVRQDGVKGAILPPVFQNLLKDERVLTGDMSITVIRPAAWDNMAYVDEFWMYLIQRTRADGIYWGYDLHRKWTGTGKRDDLFTEATIIGTAPTPYLSWLDSTSATEEGGRHYPRAKLGEVFSFGPDPEPLVHEARTVAIPNAKWDEIVLLRIFPNPPLGHEVPAIPDDCTIQLRPIDTMGELGTVVDAKLWPKAASEETEAGFLVYVDKTDLQSVPEMCYVGNESSVHVKITLSITMYLRKLQAVKAFAEGGDYQLKALCKGWANNCYTGDTKFTRKLQALPDNWRNEVNNWLSTRRLNKLQYEAVRCSLDSGRPATFVQGPPGTGKSACAMNLAQYLAGIGMSVLVCAPTKMAGKANAVKLAHAGGQIKDNHRKITSVYFPTYSETLCRIFEHIEHGKVVVSEPGDDVFENIQMWRYVLDHAKQISSTHEDAANFLKGIHELRGKPQSPGAEFMTTFRTLLKWCIADFFSQPDTNYIVVSTNSNSASLGDIQQSKIDYAIFDEAALADEADTMVPLQLKPLGVTYLGDQRQNNVVVPSTTEFQKYHKRSFFKRTLDENMQDFTLLKLSYRFPTEIASPVGQFGGYGGLGSLQRKKSAVYDEYLRITGAPLFPYRFRPAPKDAVCETEGFSKSSHRVLMNVTSGWSSYPKNGNKSPVNYANINAMIGYLREIVNESNSIITGETIMIIAPFKEQAKLWVSQLGIRWVNSGIMVVTCIPSQGNERPLAVYDTTYSSEPGSGQLSAISDWNKSNVAISRAEDVMITVMNFDQRRRAIPSLKKAIGGPTFVGYIIDALDQGIICDIPTVPHTLPARPQEFDSQDPTDSNGKWTNKQPTAQPAKNTVKQQGQSLGELTAYEKDGFSVVERELLKGVREERASCDAAVKVAHDEEAAFQKQLEEEYKEAMGGLADMDIDMDI